MASIEETDDELLEKSKSSSSNQVEEDNIADEDELLLLSSPSSSPKPSVTKKANPDTHVTKKQKVVSSEVQLQDVVDLLDEDLEIVEEVSTIPDASISDAEEESIDESEEDDEEESLFVDGKINIFYDNGAFFLWNAEDVQMLREECRIIGKLVGCLPRAPRQNLHLGLPLQLMPEEAKLLVDIDAAAVVMEKPVADTTLKIRKAAFENVRQQNFQIQQRLYKKQRKEDVSQRMDTIIAGKKAKKRKLKEANKGSKETSEDDAAKATKQEGPEENKVDERDAQNEGAGGQNKSGGKEEVEEQDSKDIEEDENFDNLTVDDIVTTETSEAHALVQVFTENPWKQNIKSFDWNFPNTERDLLRYYVFKDLWGKGFFLTSGSKFGGDFLVYPGDPARYHSHYIAVCRSQYDEMPCLDLVSLGRLASNVRKTALLCSLDRNRKVIYTSLTWTGLT